jgi:hypothetical protein
MLRNLFYLETYRAVDTYHVIDGQKGYAVCQVATLKGLFSKI